MSWTLSMASHAIVKAGSGANSTITASSAMLANWSDQAEGKLNTLTRKDWVADYSDVTANFKPILDDVVSDIVAMRIIRYDMSGYTSKVEAQVMLDALRDEMTTSIEALKNEENKEVMD